MGESAWSEGKVHLQHCLRSISQYCVSSHCAQLCLILIDLFNILFPAGSINIVTIMLSTIILIYFNHYSI